VRGSSSDVIRKNVFLSSFKFVTHMTLETHTAGFQDQTITPPDEELNTILRHPSALDFTDEILCLTV
jgi:hypothetical protein